MRKGVSPVVAIVLLIAIAVISAVAVWTWVGPLTSKPPMGSTTQYSLQVLKCYTASNSIDVKNTGGVKITSQSFTLINKADGSVASAAPFSALTLAPGEVNSSLPISGWTLQSGMMYALRAQNFPDIEFTC